MRLLLALLALSGSAHAETWISPLAGRNLIVVDSRGLPSPSFEKALGPDRVVYEAFVAARVPANRSITGLKGLTYSLEPDPPSMSSGRVGSAAIPGFYLVRFAFPIQPQWIADLARCGAEKMAAMGDGTLLVRAAGLELIRTCKTSRYLSWARSYESADRLPPDLMAETGPVEVWLQFAPTTRLELAARELPESVEILGSYRSAPGSFLFVRVLAGTPELAAIAVTHAELLTINRVIAGIPQDERQGQIVAAQHDGRKVTTPGYLQWLTARSLMSDSNQQTVALFDTGYDDGSGPGGNHHPDLEKPDRLVDIWSFIDQSPSAPDGRGHGTLVAGIVAGDGRNTGEKDPQGFLLGAGIAPKTKLVALQIFQPFPDACNVFRTATRLDELAEAFAWARTTAQGTDKALIANHSWAQNTNTYTDLGQLFDERTIDADPARVGLQPMTMIVAAGNGGPGDDTVSSPAIAKNVIAVGSTQNYRPSTQPGSPPLLCTNGVPSNEESRHIARVNETSARGRRFDPFPSPAALHTTRIKPDLVAPGGRVFSTVPFQTPETYICPRTCRAWWPDPPIGYHSYVQATSYAAPVVTGVAALKRKWFLDRGVDPAPSLLKAALIATADDLGSFYAANHRPSHAFGWGRVNLDRLTDPAARFWVNERPQMALSTGQQRSWTKTIGEPGKDTYIVLAWSDPPAPITRSSQAPLINDLTLTVELKDETVFWRGNNFNENTTGTDDGFSHAFTTGAATLADAINNVEAVFLPAGTFRTGQQVTIRVTGANVTAGPQRFAVYAYNVRR
ncbi:MAG TPA: S8 family serine peptidase [Thermoanaerobaculia bacterium]|jgi:hypothetical protein|nr:S8 family serine peptidase [Thermoanaerobaculia bacterium]